MRFATEPTLEFFIEVGEQLDSALRRRPWLTQRGSYRSEGVESAQPREPLVTLYYPCGSHSRGLSLTDVETLARATGAIEEPRLGLSTPYLHPTSPPHTARIGARVQLGNDVEILPGVSVADGTKIPSPKQPANDP